METDALIDALRAEGTRLADAAEGLDPGAAVPACPGWTVRDLLRHTGRVHRWAGAHVREARAERLRFRDELEVVGVWPDDRDLVAWYRAELALLVETLARADPAMTCFTLLPAASGRAFWARRQAHETAVHRADAEQAAGLRVTPLAPDVAADGVDELVAGFVPVMPTPLRADGPRSLRVAPVDAPANGPAGWLLRGGVGPVVTTREAGGEGPAAGCTVRGAASDLFLALWNRRGPDVLTVEGDASVLALFQATVRV